MGRVTKVRGVVAACVWDHAGGHGPLGPFWDAARELDVDAEDESCLRGTRRGHLAELFEAAVLAEIEQAAISVEVEHPSFEEWWEPFTLGVGPAGAYVARLSIRDRDQLRELCRERLPEGSFSSYPRGPGPRVASRQIPASGYRGAFQLRRRAARSYTPRASRPIRLGRTTERHSSAGFSCATKHSLAVSDQGLPCAEPGDSRG